MEEFIFKQEGKKAALDKYIGNNENVIIPDSWNGMPVTKISAKAFLSCKTVNSLVVSDNITDIDAWAFAHMKNLKEITLPANNITFGKDVFLDCPSLVQINLANDMSGNPGTNSYLTLAVTGMKDMSLVKPYEAGSRKLHSQWLKEYDDALNAYIQSADDYGFEPVFYGWFNDEDADVEQRPAYISERIEIKTSLSINRLLYPMYMTDEDKQIFSKYLVEQMEESHIESALWRLYTTKYINDIRYADILIETGCVNKDNLNILLEDLQNKHLSDTYPEVVALFLRCKLENKEDNDIFSTFVLDI